MHFKMSSAICFNLDQSKIVSSGNGLKLALCCKGLILHPNEPRLEKENKEVLLHALYTGLHL